MCARVRSSRRFAASGGDKFTDTPWKPAGSGSPILDGVVAWADCKLAGDHEAGDHHLVLGDVLDLELGESPSHPLIFHRGTYGRFTPHD